VKVLTCCLFVGPRCVTEAYRQTARAGSLRRIDVKDCAAVLGFLAARDTQVPLAELPVTDLCHGGLDEVLRQLALVDGVRLLKKKPEGLSLSSELRSQIQRLQHRTR
jgi:hypothetical protein